MARVKVFVVNDKIGSLSQKSKYLYFDFGDKIPIWNIFLNLYDICVKTYIKYSQTENPFLSSLKSTSGKHFTVLR